MPIVDASLPISAQLKTIAEALERHHQLVLEAPPGAGKTTSVPLALMEAPWRAGRKILVLEPRRIAARAAATRMAELLGEPLGHSVGYTIRLEKKVSANTIVEVVTEGVLTRRLQQDPELADTALVIFDEFHERNIHSDLGLALCLQARELFRDENNPLKLLVMSATLDGAAVSELLDAPVIRSEGRSYPVDIHYGHTSPQAANLTRVLVTTIIDALTQNRGNLLVFLPGQREIRDCAARLSPQLSETIALCSLHGGIPLYDQQQAIAPVDGTRFERKIVLTTDIAETSLTIAGVNVVIDSGLARKPKFDPRTGMTRLQTVRISRASSEQRAGRAGRLAAGVCYRLWSREQHAQLLPHTAPEIAQADLAPLALQLLHWGVADPQELRWLDPPAAPAYQQALQLLRNLGAVHGEPHKPVLTVHGEKMAVLPTEPRLAHMLLIAAEQGLLPLAAQLAALLTERDPMHSIDIQHSVQALHGEVHCANQHRPWLKRVEQQARQYRQQVITASDTSTIPDSWQISYLLASAFPDRIAKKRANSRHQYLLSNGRSARLPETDALAGEEWLAIVELGGQTGQREDTIYRATALAPDLFDTHLQHLMQERDYCDWQDGRLVAQRQTCIGQIVVTRHPLLQLSDQQYQQAVLAYVRQRGLTTLPWTPELRQWQSRVALVRKQRPEHTPAWPDVSDQHLLQTMDDWLAPFVSDIRKQADINQLPLRTILENLLPWPLTQQLNELAPERIQVPSGSNLRIDYVASPPVLEVKLQEMFGCKHTPTVVDGRVTLLVHLLSPARRPLQITQDLEGFWNTSYQDVKKEMKGRYPKHPWPDNPWEAQATRFTKKRTR